VSTAARWIVAVAISTACGSPEPRATDAAQMPESTGSEQVEPASAPSDLLLRLGGQTGSEMAQGVLMCTERQTDYGLSDVTPLGFSAIAVAESVVGSEYRASGIGLDEGPAQLRVELAAPVTFIDRDPSANPKLVCADAVRVGAVFEVLVEGQSLSLPVVNLFADAADRFVGKLDSIDVDALPATLAEAAGGGIVSAIVESLGDGVVVWFQRRLPEGNDEVIGRVAPAR
jgi:hypothetical protein